MYRLDGRVAVVTGGTGAIGSAVARALTAAGAHTCVIDRDIPDDPPGVPAAGRPWHHAVTADVSDADEVASTFEHIQAEVGPVDILINNAGIASSDSFPDITAQSWDEVLGVNANGAFLCAREAFLQMRPRGWGRIIQVSSVSAQNGALLGHAHYSASKGALLSLTKTLSRSCAPFAITVNAIAPGVIRTDLSDATLGPAALAELEASIPLGLGTTDDVASAVVFLASEESRYITGTTLDVNGGQYLR